MPTRQCLGKSCSSTPIRKHAARSTHILVDVPGSVKWEVAPPPPPRPSNGCAHQPRELDEVLHHVRICLEPFHKPAWLRGGTHTAAQTVWCGAVTMGVCVSHPPRIGMKCCDTPDTASGSCSFCFLLSFGCVSPCESKRWNDWEPGWRQDSTRDRNTPLGSEGRPGGRDLPSSPFISPSFPLHVQLDKNLSSHSR